MWWDHVFKSFYLQQYPFDIPTEAFPFEIFKQAFVAVQSCVVHLQVKTWAYIYYSFFFSLHLLLNYSVYARVTMPISACAPPALFLLGSLFNQYWLIIFYLTQNVSLARRFALVPLGPPLLAYRSNCRAMLTAVDGAVELKVDRPYKAGESIVVWYESLSIS